MWPKLCLCPSLPVSLLIKQNQVHLCDNKSSEELTKAADNKRRTSWIAVFSQNARGTLVSFQMITRSDNKGAETGTMIKGLCHGWKPITHALLLLTVLFFLRPIFIVPTKHRFLLADWFCFPLRSSWKQLKPWHSCLRFFGEIKLFNEVSCLLFHSYTCKNIWNMPIPWCTKDSFFQLWLFPWLPTSMKERKKKKKRERDNVKLQEIGKGNKRGK